MAERRCIFCGRLADIGGNALFRLPPDYRRVPDEIYRRYAESRGRYGVSVMLPDVCGKGSPDFGELSAEDGKPVLVTKTGRITDILVCPSCHNELYRDTDDASVNTAVVFGDKGSGKTTLILSLAEGFVTRQFSSDNRYRYILNEEIHDGHDLTEAAKSAAEGTAPADLREPVAIYRVSEASSDEKVVCDVLHDTSFHDTEDDLSVGTALPFAADAGHYVYCLPVDRLSEAVIACSESEDMRIRRDMYAMMSAFRYADAAPVLDIVITKFDLAEKCGGAGEDIYNMRGSESALKNYLYSAFPSLRDSETFFSGMRLHTFSAASSADDDGSGTEQLHNALFEQKTNGNGTSNNEQQQIFGRRL